MMNGGNYYLKNHTIKGVGDGCVVSIDSGYMGLLGYNVFDIQRQSYTTSERDKR